MGKSLTSGSIQVPSTTPLKLGFRVIQEGLLGFVHKLTTRRGLML